MRSFIVFVMMSFIISPAFAENLFQNNNPFPQTMPQSMNNIYESEPAAIQKEMKQENKSWFRKGKNLQKQEAEETSQYLQKYPVNEGASEGSFYIFK